MDLFGGELILYHMGAGSNSPLEVQTEVCQRIPNILYDVKVVTCNGTWFDLVRKKTEWLACKGENVTIDISLHGHPANHLDIKPTRCPSMYSRRWRWTAFQQPAADFGHEANTGVSTNWLFPREGSASSTRDLRWSGPTAHSAWAFWGSKRREWAFPNVNSVACSTVPVFSVIR